MDVVVEDIENPLILGCVSTRMCFNNGSGAPKPCCHVKMTVLIAKYVRLCADCSAITCPAKGKTPVSGPLPKKLGSPPLT
ncbi:hypothetical protein FIB18_23935 [Brucella pecoris]|uniref:Uncharacterized protein n=1 Tax=Brucella pecoris TaxID=867683 RepID=A0A5C5CBV7_9HYPH|nr:hypothetical protein FIB18_23935 [Brucella pecoris]